MPRVIIIYHKEGQRLPGILKVLIVQQIIKGMVEMRLIRIHMPRVMLLYGRNSLPRLFEIEFIHQEFGGGAIFRTSFWKEV